MWPTLKDAGNKQQTISIFGILLSIVSKTKKSLFSAMVSTTRQTFSSLSVRNFRLFAIGQAISLCGTWMQTVAMGWLVLQLTHSGTQLGLVTAAQFLPILIIGVWGGVIADRFNKRRILYLTQTLSGLLALVLGILTLRGNIEVWMVYLISLGFGLTLAVDSPARQAFVIEMVGKERIKNAVTINAIIVSFGRIIGPAIAGVTIAAFDVGPCFIFNAVSFIAVVVALMFMRKAELHPSRPVPKQKGQVVAGLKYAWHVPEIKTILVMMVIIGTFAYEFPVVLPLLATKTFGGGAGTYSLLTSVMSVGAMVGGIYTAGKSKVGMKTIFRITAAFGTGMIALAYSPNIVTALIVLVLVGMYSMMFIATTNAALQLTTSSEMRGRVMALLSITFLGTTPIGGPIMGYISTVASPRTGILIGGISIFVAMALGRMSMGRRKLRA